MSGQCDIVLKKDGNTYDLPFFGIRLPRCCFVCADSVGTMLGIKEIRRTLIHTNSMFVLGLHYAYIPFESPTPTKVPQPLNALGGGEGLPPLP
jgi:hypothetical protein